MRKLMYAAGVMLLTGSALAQSPAPPTAEQPQANPAQEGEEITVVGLGERAYRLTPVQLRGAVAAFEGNRAEFSPTARLTWNVLPRGPHPEVRLALKSKDEVIGVPLGADGGFVLPHDKILSGEFRLVTTAAKAAIKIQPIALSAGATREKFHFGDARLSCRVMWGFISAQYSIMARGAFAMVGGCASSRVKVFMGTERPVASVSIAGWGKPVELGKEARSWLVPLAEKSIANDAAVQVTYQAP
jgi:hypothetical protein